MKLVAVLRNQYYFQKYALLSFCMRHALKSPFLFMCNHFYMYSTCVTASQIENAPTNAPTNVPTNAPTNAPTKAPTDSTAHDAMKAMTVT